MSCSHSESIETYLDNKVRKTYQVYIENDDPRWLDMIKRGEKTYEGRIFTGDWKNLNPGDQIEFFSSYTCPSTPSENKCLVKIKSINRYKNFGDAFDDLDYSLVPISGISREDAENLCMKSFYSNEVILYGVVAVKMKLKEPRNSSETHPEVTSAPPLPSESWYIPDWVSFIIINIFLLVLVCMFMWI